MMHLAAWYESIDQVALGPLTVVTDGILTPLGADRFLVPKEHRFLYAAAALGSDLTRAQIVTPSLEVKRITLEVIPHERGTIAFNLDSIRAMALKREIEFDPVENIEFHTSEDGAGATAQIGLVWLKPTGPLPPMPDGPIRIVRCTSATTLGAYAWTSCALTPEKALEAGRYALVGFLAMSATGIAARAVILGDYYRTGVPVLPGAEEAARDFDITTLNPFLYYTMGEFDHTDIPQIEFLASAGDTAEQVILFLVKIG